MLRGFIAVLLLLTLSVQCFHKAFVVVSFYWNQSYIAKTLCENKAKPQLKCGGKCQLMKKLQQEEKKEQQLPNLKWGGKEEVLSSKSFFATLPAFFTSTFHTYNTFLLGTLAEYREAIFHPPAMAA